MNIGTFFSSFLGMAAHPNQRLFLGIQAPEELNRLISDINERLKVRSRAIHPLRVSWVPAQNYHLTLKFLGPTPHFIFDELVQRFATLIESTPSFEIRLGGLGAFPNPRKPRIVWLGAQEPTGGLQRLVQKLEADLKEYSKILAADHRMSMSRLVEWETIHPSFHPHITLARIKYGQFSSILSGLSSEMNSDLLNIKVGTFAAQEVILFESITKPEGSVYHPLVKFKMS